MVTAPADRHVVFESGSGAATITLDAPANRNALSAALVDGMQRGLERAAEDPAVRSVVLTHTGGTFCAGADLAEAASEGGPTRGTERLVALLRAIITHPKPVLAVIDGHVRAGGLGLLGACDVVIAGPASTFALTEARLGLAPAIISLTLAAKVDARAWARYALSGERFGSAEAAGIGLVTEAVENPAVSQQRFTEAFAAASPQGLAATKELVNEDVVARFDADAEALTRRSAALFASEEAQEGIAAFRERRTPRW